MSATRRPSTTSDSSNRSIQSETNTLRPLAPKTRPLAPRPPLSSSSSPSDRSTRSRPHILQFQASIACRVCLRLGCQLSTHRAFEAGVGQSRISAADVPASVDRPAEAEFTASYAYALAQRYADRNADFSSIDGLYDLPIKADLNTTEMHRLFHDFFVRESQSNFRITPPPEIVGDLIFAPFFVPAIYDSALCLSILATAAATIPAQSEQRARNITSLTLIGETMQQMRERIELDPHHISDATIVAATFLWLVNTLLEDVGAAESHAQSVVRFVASRGGLGELGMAGAVAQFIRWTDILSSLMTILPCRFLDVQDPEAISAPPIQRYGAFWAASRSPLEGEIHHSIIFASQESCKIIELLEAVEQGGLSGRHYIFLVSKLCFLCTRDSITRLEFHRSNTIDECIVEAVSLIKIKCFCANDNLNILIKKSAECLADAIHRAFGGKPTGQPNLDLLIWLLFTVSLSPDVFEARKWCLNLLSEAIVLKLGHPRAWVATWTEELNQTLRSFVWSDRQLGSNFLEICKSIVVPEQLDNHDEASTLVRDISRDMGEI